MNDTPWSGRATQLLDTCTPTMQGLWTALFTTQNAALTLALSASTMPVGEFTEIAMDLADGVDAIEMCRPELAAGPSVQLPLVSPIADYAGPSGELAALIARCIELAAGTLANKDEYLTSSEVLAVSRAVHSLADSHVRLTGRLP